MHSMLDVIVRFHALRRIVSNEVMRSYILRCNSSITLLLQNKFSPILRAVQMFAFLILVGKFEILKP